jgi:hypothetical protein
VSLLRRLKVTGDRTRCIARYHPNLKLAWEDE